MKKFKQFIKENDEYITTTFEIREAYSERLISYIKDKSNSEFDKKEQVYDYDTHMSITFSIINPEESKLGSHISYKDYNKNLEDIKNNVQEIADLLNPLDLELQVFNNTKSIISLWVDIPFSVFEKHKDFFNSINAISKYNL